MAEELVVSKPADIQRRTKLIKLPVPQNGLDIVLRIGALRTVTVIAAFDGIPGGSDGAHAGERTFAQMREALVNGMKPTAMLAAEGILEPEFSFEQREEGKAYWDDLVEDNKAAVIRELMELSTWKAGATKDEATFREGAGGK